MKKKVLSALLTTTMLASMLVGCGSSNDALQHPPTQHPLHLPRQLLQQLLRQQQSPQQKKAKS